MTLPVPLFGGRSFGFSLSLSLSLSQGFLVRINIFNYLSIYRSLLNPDVIDRENIILDQFYDWVITPAYQHVYESGILIQQAISQF